MILKSTLTTMLCCMAGMATAQSLPLSGFDYGNATAPSGNEWQSPEQLAYNKLQPRAWFFSFADVQSALRVLPEHSAYWQSLNGQWKFHFAKNPDERPKTFFDPSFDVSTWDNIAVPSSWNIYGVQTDGTLKYGVPIYVNQWVIFKYERKVDDWKNGVMRVPPTNYTTYQYRNEVGSFRRTFDVPASWKGRDVYISFDGVDSFFYLWINGRYVGFSKNSRNAARFLISPYLNKKGSNTVAVEVYRSSDASFLEAQDMFRLPGIFRTVAIYSEPKVHVSDLVAIPDLDADYVGGGKLHITATLQNLARTDAKDCHMEYSLYANELHSDATTLTDASATSTTATVAKEGGAVNVDATLSIANPDLWTAESPHRYTLVGRLINRKGDVADIVSTIVGFRKVEIKDTPASQDEFGLAGRYFYVNGRTLKLKGVNRHETNPALGHAITREQMEREVMLMKRANINHVRCSHYPDDPYWFYLCNKYGIYLEDEANLESHEYFYGKESLSHPVEWMKAHVARNIEMVRSNINDPCIVIWSLGNEAGPGHNFVAAYDSIKRVDTSRPVQYERNNDIVDMGSNQYPSIDWVRSAVKGTMGLKYPFHISEYAHSMGNAEGNLIDYWNAIESTDFFCGGAIWDWVDQSMYAYDRTTGKRYLAYGGDFGDTPNDGQFVMNGIMFGELDPKPQYFEVKKVYQYFGVRAVDLAKGDIEIFNKNYYTDTSDNYDVRWSLYADGQPVQQNTLLVPNIAPRRRATVHIPFAANMFDPAKEYFLKVQFLLKSDMPWAKAGYVQAEEQLPIPAAAVYALAAQRGDTLVRPAIAAVTAKLPKLDLAPAANGIQSVKGANFEARFDLAQGTLQSLVYGGTQVIADNGGPRLDAFRAPTNNDNWFYQSWFERGLHNLCHRVLSYNVTTNAAGDVILHFNVESQAPNGARLNGGDSRLHNIVEQTDRPFGPSDFRFTTNQVWTVYKDGSIELQAAVTSNEPSLVLPRLGYLVRVPQRLSHFTYYGRGPIDNYPDRRTGQFIERFSSTVQGEVENFPKPQDMANHQDTRWCALTDEAGTGVLFVGAKPMSVSALPYSAQDLTLAGHPYQLQAPADTYLHLDLAVTGLGGNSCGQGGPLDADRVKAGPHTFGFIIRPAGADLTAAANISPSGQVPLTITRDAAGLVTISSDQPRACISYTLSPRGKVQTYTAPFNLAGGGTVTAWEKNAPSLRSTFTCSKIESVPTKVIFASSVESGEGDAEHLTDGNPNTYWHTMYSVTVANYPHWVDFDCGTPKLIKGFVYLPRQDSANGNIRDYKVQLSTDGHTWSDPVASGTFERNQKEKRVLFSQPRKARYLRFTALSSQDGQDFATGAEFTVLAE